MTKIKLTKFAIIMTQNKNAAHLTVDRAYAAAQQILTDVARGCGSPVCGCIILLLD